MCLSILTHFKGIFSSKIELFYLLSSGFIVYIYWKDHGSSSFSDDSVTDDVLSIPSEERSLLPLKIGAFNVQRLGPKKFNDQFVEDILIKVFTMIIHGFYTLCFKSQNSYLRVIVTWKLQDTFVSSIRELVHGKI